MNTNLLEAQRAALWPKGLAQLSSGARKRAAWPKLSCVINITNEGEYAVTRCFTGSLSSIQFIDI